MHTTITARHVDLNSELRQRAVEVLDRLGRIGPRARRAVAVFDRVSGRPSVEFRLHTDGGPVLVAVAEANDHRSALDLVSRKIRRQLLRLQTRPVAARRALPT